MAPTANADPSTSLRFAQDDKLNGDVSQLADVMLAAAGFYTAAHGRRENARTRGSKMSKLNIWLAFDFLNQYVVPANPKH